MAEPDRAKLVENEPYLCQLTAYIKLNPAPAGLAQDPAEWPWSEHLVSERGSSGTEKRCRELPQTRVIRVAGSLPDHLVDKARRCRAPQPAPSPQQRIQETRIAETSRETLQRNR